MRQLSPNQRLQAFSLPEVIRAWEHATTDLSATYRHFDRKLKPGPLLNAIALAFCKMLNDDKRHEMARWGLAELARLQSLDDDEGSGVGREPSPVKLGLVARRDLTEADDTKESTRKTNGKAKARPGGKSAGRKGVK